jgi:type I restriction enzyme S subunit
VRAPVGPVNFSTTKICIGRGLAAIRATELINKDYLFHFLVKHEAEIVGNTGAVFNSINKSQIEDISIPFPPLYEQQRIVSTLDEVFTAIATAKENAEAYLQYSRDLAESYLQTIFAKPCDRWEEKQLGDLVADIITGPFGSMLHKSDYVSNGVPVINPQNIVNGKIIPLQSTMVSQQTRERLSKFILKEKDLVVARRGEMGRCSIVSTEQIGWLCGTGSLVIRVKKDVNEKYLAIILGSAKIKSILENDSIGATMSNLNQGILLQIKIPLPSLSEQHSIVETFDAISTETNKLEVIYKKKMSNLDELKKSILHKAFNGELSGAN